MPNILANNINDETLMLLSIAMLDITMPEHVKIDYDTQRKVLYVHVNGITVLRICRIKRLELEGFMLNHNTFE